MKHRYAFYETDEDGNYIPPDNNPDWGFSPALTSEHRQLLSDAVNKYNHSTEKHGFSDDIKVQKFASNDGTPGNYEIIKRPNSTVENS